MLAPHLPTEPYWLGLPRGVRVEIKPVITAWSNEANIGICVRNIDAFMVDVRLVSGFTQGIRSLGDGRGIEDSTFHLGRILNCKVGLDVRCATATAWNTYIRYYGGHFAVATGVNLAVDRFGAEPGAYLNHNRHVFDAPNFELRQRDHWARPAHGGVFANRGAVHRGGPGL